MTILLPPWVFLFVFICPDDTKLVGWTCVDEFEAPNQKGAKPLVMQSAFDGETWCEERGKRLCTMKEWVDACEGTPIEKPLVPQGRVQAPGACNNDKEWRYVNEKRLNNSDAKVSLREVLRVWQGEPSGSRDKCVSSTGVRDTIGNVEEWVVSPSDPFGYALMGHYWARTGSRCTDRVNSHAPRFFYYETGFRCCSTPRMTATTELEKAVQSFLSRLPSSSRTDPQRPDSKAP